jgi:hypothetical protein
VKENVSLEKAALSTAMASAKRSIRSAGPSNAIPGSA